MSYIYCGLISKMRDICSNLTEGLFFIFGPLCLLDYYRIFGLVYLFNDISTFVDHLMPKPSCYIIQPIAGEIKEDIPFPRILVQK